MSNKLVDRCPDGQEWSYGYIPIVVEDGKERVAVCPACHCTVSESSIFDATKIDYIIGQEHDHPACKCGRRLDWNWWKELFNE